MTKKKLPTKVRVGLAEYSITIGGHDLAKENAGNIGMCYPATKKIWLAEGQQLPCMAQTLWHELFHAGAYEYSTHYVVEPNEEYVVDVSSHILCQLLRDNPELGAWTLFAVTS